ncbi:MAG: amidohydrolase family protein [Gemmatimonadota bacterium]|nr:amidohydrolase family protein [Gemmatimonadota bacterium]
MVRATLLISLLSLASLSTAAREHARLTYEFRGGLWWTGSGFEPRTMYSVDGVFSSRGPAVVDSVIGLNGRYVIPPFAEAHTHTIAYVRSRIDEFLEQGVFYALVMNVHRSSIGESFTWFGGPRSVDVNFTSLGVTASDGHPIQIGLRGDATLDDVDGDWITIVDSQEDIDAKWASLHEANPDLIKLFLLYSEHYSDRHGDATIAHRYKGMDPLLVRPLVVRAHDAGLRVAAHVRTAHDFHVAVDAGVDIVAHLPGFSMGPGSLGQLDDPARIDEIEHPERFRIRPRDAALAAARRVTVIPTVGSFESLPDTLASGLGTRLQEISDVRRDVIEANLRVLRENGVRIAVGSDAGEGSPVTEALGMHQLGVFTNVELLQMLTEHAARVTFPRRSVGRLSDGYEASFLALAGDPTERFDRIRDVVYRFKQGEPLDVSDSESRGTGERGEAAGR